MGAYGRSVEIAAPVEAVFDFHLHTQNLVRITPWWMRVRVLDEQGDYADGTKRVRLRSYLFGVLPATVHIHFIQFDRPRALDDCQEQGPFARWVQQRRFRQIDGTRAQLHDSVEYRLPLGILGELADRLLVRRLVRRMFVARQRLTCHLIESGEKR